MNVLINSRGLILRMVLLMGYLSLSLMARAQTDDQPSPDVWYVWIDTEAKIDGTMHRLISDKPIMITCCVKSAKYRRLVKHASKWLRKNYVPDFSGQLALMKLQDRELAEKIVSDIQRGVKPSKYPVKVVTYRARCVK